jgi:hydrogenase maturation protease
MSSSPKHLVPSVSPVNSRPESMVHASPSLAPGQNWRSRLEYLIAKTPVTQKIAIIGIGHPLKSDDYVGSLIAKDMEQKTRHGRVVVVNAEHSPENFLGRLQEDILGLLILIDSLDAGESPGTIALFDLDEATDSFFATHNISMRQILDTLSHHPTTVLLGIQPRSLEVAGRLSKEVSHARLLIVKELGRIIDTLRRDQDAH